MSKRKFASADSLMRQLKSKKFTTTEKDFERMAENLWANKSKSIRDQNSFEKAFDEYFDTQTVLYKNEKGLKKKIFGILTKKHDGISRDIITQKKETKKKRTIKQKEFILRVQKGQDVSNYEPEKRYEFFGRQQTEDRVRRVYARVIPTKRGLRYIDRRGRYVSIRTPE